MAKLFLLRYEKSPVRDDADLAPAQRSLYEEMTFRTPLSGKSNATIVPETISAALAVSVQKFVGNNYRFLVVGLAWGSLAALILMAVYFRRVRLADSGAH